MIPHLSQIPLIRHNSHDHILCYIRVKLRNARTQTNILMLLPYKMNKSLCVFSLPVIPLCSAGCEPIPVQYVRWGDPEPIAAVAFSCLGLMATLFVTSVFIK